MTSHNANNETVAVVEAPSQLSASSQEQCHFAVLTSCYSLCGFRENNQDMAVCLQFKAQGSKRIAVAAVQDGMGGPRAGEMAALHSAVAFTCQIVSMALAWTQRNVELDITHLLVRAFHAAQEQVLRFTAEHPECEGMGTTQSVATIAGNALYVGNVGDSRCYQWHRGELRQLTRDDSFVQTLVEQGAISADEAAHHVDANVLTRVVGCPGDLENLVIATHEIEPGDIVVLCSDGVWHCGQHLIADACSRLFQREFSQAALDQWVAKLVDEALREGADDNVSVAVLWIEPPQGTAERVENHPDEGKMED